MIYWSDFLLLIDVKEQISHESSDKAVDKGKLI